jgi:hypothetical protein
MYGKHGKKHMMEEAEKRGMQRFILHDVPSPCQQLVCRTSEGERLMKDELQGVWKEVVIA